MDRTIYPVRGSVLDYVSTVPRTWMGRKDFLTIFYSPLNMKSSIKKTDVQAADEAESAEAEAPAQTPEKGPLWSDESESRRVRATIWSHPQKSGRTRYTTGICRSYYDERQSHWVNTFYYDERDLDDVIVFAQEAKKKLARINGEPESL